MLVGPTITAVAVTGIVTSTAPAGESPAPAAGERPEGSAWIIGFVIFVLAFALIVGGRWWIRNRVGRVRR